MTFRRNDQHRGRESVLYRRSVGCAAVVCRRALARRRRAAGEARIGSRPGRRGRGARKPRPRAERGRARGGDSPARAGAAGPRWLVCLLKHCPQQMKTNKSIPFFFFLFFFFFFLFFFLFSWRVGGPGSRRRGARAPRRRPPAPGDHGKRARPNRVFVRAAGGGRARQTAEAKLIRKRQNGGFEIVRDGKRFTAGLFARALCGRLALGRRGGGAAAPSTWARGAAHTARASSPSQLWARSTALARAGARPDAQGVTGEVRARGRAWKRTQHNRRPSRRRRLQERPNSNQQ